MKRLFSIIAICLLLVPTACKSENPESPGKVTPVEPPVDPEPPEQVEIPEIFPVSLQVTSSEETFGMRRLSETGHVFAGVSCFTATDVTMSGTTGNGDTFSFEYPSPVDGPAWLEVDFDSRTCNFTPMPIMLVQGTALKSISNTMGARLEYKGHGVYSGTNLVFDADGLPIYDRSLSFSFTREGSWYPAFERISGTRRSIAPASAGETEVVRINPGEYDVTLDLRSYIFDVTHSGELDPYRITVMGSSVPWGQGATEKNGYIRQLGAILATQSPLPWYISNLSVPGDETTKLSQRFDEQTVDGGKTLIIALSLGNEGLASASSEDARRALYEQWENRVYLNDDSFVKTALAEGKQVIVTGNYAKGTYTEAHYSWIRKINLDIQQWDVPSVNLMGAIDAGNGKWMEGYYADASHPNDAGHREMALAVVPSLFDALHAGKEPPHRHISEGMSLPAGSAVHFKPQGAVHPFTLSFGMRTSARGQVMEIDGDGFSRNLYVSNAGKLFYDGFACTTPVGDGQWHQISISHFYAQGKTYLYVDGFLQGSLSERLAPGAFWLGSASSDISVRELFFWRSGMNAEEMQALQEGRMLKSSLEIYAPLDGTLDNTAQSTNSLSLTAAPEYINGGMSVLAIGNSFSVDAMQYLYDILASDGATGIVLGNLYIGGCTLETHSNHFLANDGAYTYYENTSGSWTKTTSAAPLTALDERDWDYITIQQASGSSGLPGTYNPYLDNIVGIVRQHCPDARILWHMTWAYQSNSSHKEFPNYGSDQMQMYNAIVSTVQSVIVPNSVFSGIIPSGTAVQNLRTSLYGDTLTRDGYHLSYDVGRYIAGLTWAAVLRGTDPANVLWAPAQYSYSLKERSAIREAVSNAVAKPFEVTQSSYIDTTEGISGDGNLQDFDVPETYTW